MILISDDGGRAAAGFRGRTGDCVTRAVAIATGRPYLRVYYELNELGKRERLSKHRKTRSSARDGVWIPTLRTYLKQLGWTWTPTMHVGSGCKVHLRADELPTGKLIVRLSGHIVAVIDGVAHDIADHSRGGRRCVYGYWRKLNS